MTLTARSEHNPLHLSCCKLTLFERGAECVIRRSKCYFPESHIFGKFGADRSKLPKTPFSGNDASLLPISDFSLLIVASKPNRCAFLWRKELRLFCDLF